MPRRGAQRPGLIDWIILAAALLTSASFLIAGGAGRLDAARLLRQTLLRPYRLVIGYEACPADPWNEVRRLRLELAERSLDRTRLEELEREALRLRRSLDFRDESAIMLRPALVVGRSQDGFGEMLTTSRPSGGALRPGQSVIGLAGLVGAVLDFDGDGGEVRVRTLRNGALRVSAMLEESREAGFLRWRPAQRMAVLEGISIEVEVPVGERVVSSGYGRIFPKGILIGTVVAVARDSTLLVQNIRLRLAEDLDRVEEVFLIED
ncbi:MAG: rod shape-determining protein MreC [Candidatus Eisenbacteria bacterium]